MICKRKSITKVECNRQLRLCVQREAEKHNNYFPHMWQLGPKSPFFVPLYLKRLIFCPRNKSIWLLIWFIFNFHKKTPLWVFSNNKQTDIKKHCDAVGCHTEKAKLMYQPWARYTDIFCHPRQTNAARCHGVALGSQVRRRGFFGLARGIQVFKRVWGRRQRQQNKSDTPISLFVNHPLPTRKSFRRLFKDGRRRHSRGLIGSIFIVESFDYWFHTEVISTKFA